MFIVKLRQNKNAVTDFSAILAYQEKGANQDFRLRRYNGKHEHTGQTKNKSFLIFTFIMPRNAIRTRGAPKKAMPCRQTYSDIRGALACLIQDCNIRIEKDAQTSIFDNL